MIFCLFLKEDVALYRERMPLIFPSQRSELEGGGEEKSVEEKSVEADKSVEEDKAAEPREEKVGEDEDLAKL